jgi:hemoglobin
MGAQQNSPHGVDLKPVASGYVPRDDAGLTVAIVRNVVIAFYAKVRQDPVLGPVFEAIVGDHWDTHIEKVCSFWLYVTRLDRTYNARDFMPAHIKHPTIQAELLPTWLRLFRQTAQELYAGATADALIDIAERMATSIEMSLSVRDGKPSPLTDRPPSRR